MRNFLIGWLLIVCLMAANAQAEQISVAVASNFNVAMREIVQRFEQETGHQVVLSFASSGKIFAQIQHGAPFNVFFSADQVIPTKLVDLGLAVAGSQFTYAVGSLVLWSKDSTLIDEEAKALRELQFNRLAIANPKLAPYGAAAVDVLANLQLVEQTRPRWVRGENINQTFQFVMSGNADMGFIALSQVMKNNRIEMGSAWIIPSNLYQPIRQDAVLLKNGSNSPAAKALLQFMKSESALEIIRSFGYRTAE